MEKAQKDLNKKLAACFSSQANRLAAIDALKNLAAIYGNIGREGDPLLDTLLHLENPSIYNHFPIFMSEPLKQYLKLQSEPITTPIELMHAAQKTHTQQLKIFNWGYWAETPVDIDFIEVFIKKIYLGLEDEKFEEIDFTKPHGFSQNNALYINEERELYRLHEWLEKFALVKLGEVFNDMMNPTFTVGLPAVGQKPSQ